MSFSNGQLIPLIKLDSLNEAILALKSQLVTPMTEGENLSINKSTLENIVAIWDEITSLDASDTTNNIEDELANIEEFLNISK